MTWNHRIRQLHRWIAIAFVLGFAANLAALTQAAPALWVGLLALLPLIFLLLTGLWLFAIPYVARQRR